MALLLLDPHRDMQPWKDALLQVDSNLDIEIWPNVKHPKRVQFAVAWHQPKHALDSYPNLKAVSSLGAGADHLLNDETVPEHITICRVVSDDLARQMKEYILSAVLNFQRQTFGYYKQQKEANWTPHNNKSPDDFSIGVMGLGELGKPVAMQLAAFGYQVKGWSKSAKNIDAVQTYSGDKGLKDFLSETTLLVCLLPLTPQTEGLLDLELFKKMQHPGYLINVARGEHLVEEDLIYALDKGWLEGATLDVFSKEPLPDQHPFWNRDSIFITPHVSSITLPAEVAPQIVDNYKRVISGMKLHHVVDREKGY